MKQNPNSHGRNQRPSTLKKANPPGRGAIRVFNEPVAMRHALKPETSLLIISWQASKSSRQHHNRLFWVEEQNPPSLSVVPSLHVISTLVVAIKSIRPQLDVFMVSERVIDHSEV